MQEQIGANLRRPDVWKRIVFMLVFALIDGLVKLALWLVVILQTLSILITGLANHNLLEFGRNLSIYHFQIFLFLTFNQQQLPFPFSKWEAGIHQQGQLPKF